MWILDSNCTSFYVVSWVAWSCWRRKMSSSEGGMFPLCKNSLYAFAYVACAAKNWLTWRKSFTASVTGNSTARTYVQIRRAVGMGKLLVPPVWHPVRSGMVKTCGAVQHLVGESFSFSSHHVAQLIHNELCIAWGADECGSSQLAVLASRPSSYISICLK